MNVMKVQVTLMNSVLRMTKNKLSLYWLIIITVRWHCTITVTRSKA